MVYRLPEYVPWLCGLFAVACVLVGVALIVRRTLRGPGILALAVGLFFGGVLTPTFALDTVVLDDEQLVQTTGLWFAPTVKGFRFEDVAHVSIGIGPDARGRLQELWTVHRVDGAVVVIDPGDLWEWNRPDLVARLRAKGVDVRE